MTIWQMIAVGGSGLFLAWLWVASVLFYQVWKGMARSIKQQTTSIETMARKVSEVPAILQAWNNTLDKIFGEVAEAVTTLEALKASLENVELPEAAEEAFAAHESKMNRIDALIADKPAPTPA